MAEDLSQWLDYAADGTPRLKPGVRSLPPMKPRPVAGRAATNGSGRAASGAGKDTTSGKTSEPKRKAATDRFGVLNAFVDCSLAGLSRSEIAVWLVLYRDTRDGTVRTSQENIAKRAGTSLRHVKKAIAGLKAAGLLSVVFQGGLNKGPSRYRVEPLLRSSTKGGADSPANQQGTRRS